MPAAPMGGRAEGQATAVDLFPEIFLMRLAAVRRPKVVVAAVEEVGENQKLWRSVLAAFLVGDLEPLVEIQRQHRIREGLKRYST